MDGAPGTLETPDQHPITPVEPPSNSMTISLRRRAHGESPLASVHSAADSLPDVEANTASHVADASDENVDEALVTASSKRSSSSTGSPPVELIAVSDDGSDDRQDDTVCVENNMDISASDPPACPNLIVDPMTQFPWRTADESISDTVQRLIQYLANTDPVDADILFDLIKWLESYLEFAKKTDPGQVLSSRNLHMHFWLAFPDAMCSLTTKRSEIVKVPVIRNALLAVYSQYTVLTALFISLDCLACREARSAFATAGDRRHPEILAPIYLQQLVNAIGPLGLSQQGPNDSVSGANLNHLDLDLRLATTFLESPGGSIECLSEFAHELQYVMAQVPRLTDSLAPLSQILAACVRQSLQQFRAGQQDFADARRRLELGLEAWSTISSTLVTIIDKHVTCLSSECANISIQALSEVLKCSLQGGHAAATDDLANHRTKYPSVAPQDTHEAIAWQWKFDVLEKLIRSSQMTLRVMAVTTMCNNLVSIWRRHCDGSDEYGTEFFGHLAKYLLQTGLIDYILGANCHPEIILESANIIGFLVVTRFYVQDHTEQIWRGIISSQDPRVSDALARMIASITNLFDYNGLLQICNRLRQLPLDRFSPSIRHLLDSVLREMLARSKSEQPTLTFHPYGLCLRLLRESSVFASSSQVADPEMQQFAMQKFRELLGHGPDSEGRRELYLSCLSDLAAKSPTSLGSLWALSMATRHTLVGQMQILTEQHDLARLIVEELEHAGNAGRAAGAFPVLFGTCNQPRRDFVTSLIELQPTAIDGSLGFKLWDLLVGSLSACPDDRRAGWYIILSTARKTALQNPFLQTCFSDYLPKLAPVYFCEGMLDFIKEHLHPLLTDRNGLLDFDDEAVASRSGIEQLWRIILQAQDEELVQHAISTLAVEVYLESRAITSCALHRTRQLHLAFVARCLSQMKEAATKLKRSSEGTTRGDDEPMIIVTTDEENRELQRTMTRSLRLLRFFLERYQSKPRFAVADLRSFMSEKPQRIDGDSAHLKYQSFNGDKQSDILLLDIGRLNTVSSLLASFRDKTGFDNYRVFYRGRQLLLSEQDTCKSLQELGIHDGFVLVKREESNISFPSRIKPGSLPLEIEILSHFADFWDYLSMDDCLAEEIYNFVVKLPADGYILSLLDTDVTSYKDLFLSGQPFRSLYAIHALKEYVESASRARSAGTNLESNGCYTSREKAMKRSLRLVVQALSDAEVLQGSSTRLQIRLASSLMQEFVRLTKALYGSVSFAACDAAEAPSPKRLMEVLSDALEYPEQEALPLIASTCSAILKIGQLDDQFWKEITSMPSFAQLVQRLVLFDPRKEVRLAAVKLIGEAAEFEAQPLQVSADPAPKRNERSFGLGQFLWPITVELLPEAVRLAQQCEEAFVLLLKLLLLISNKMLLQTRVDSLAVETSKLLLQHHSSERITHIEPYDAVAAGLTSVLYACLQIDSRLPASDVLPDDLVYGLFMRHLFPRKLEQGELSVPQVVLNTETRAKLYDIVFALIRQNHVRCGQVLGLLNGLVPFYAGEDDPYKYELPYQFDRSKAMRSSCGYVGLRNLSNTCYLNSLLTQLYMNVKFRRFIMTSPCPDMENPQGLLFETQKIFGFMQESYRRFVDPTSLVSSVKTYEDTFIDIHSQMDVDEFYSLLFDRWEGQLLRPEDKRRLRSFYGGQLVQQVKSKECEHISERLEPFSAIQCDIKGKSSLEESLQAYVDGEIMEGDNKYKCSSCDRHVDAVKRACLKDVPDNVIFHLKRFDFNLRTLQRSKINDHFTFPQKLDMRPYTIEHLSEASTDATEDEFELVGILVHAGTAESGHYYSYIKERPLPGSKNSWVEFNDDVVSLWDPSLMSSSTFGGPETRPLYETNGVAYDKSYSAYMLFYQRASSLRTEQQAMTAHQIGSPLLVEASMALREHIASENTVLLRRHCLYDSNHVGFVENCFSLAKTLDESEVDGIISLRPRENRERQRLQGGGHRLRNVAMQMAVSHLDQVVSRACNTPSLVSFSSMLRAAIVNCAQCALAFYTYFSQRHKALRALLQRSPEQHVRCFVGEALVCAAEKIATHLPRLYESGGDVIEASDDSPNTGGRSVAEGIVDMLNHLWQFFQVHLRSWEEYFGTVLAFARLGDRETSLLLSNDYLVKVLSIVTADVSTDLPANYARMLANVLRRMSTRPPSYCAILALMDYLLGQLEPTLSPQSITDQASDRLMGKAPFLWTSEEIQIVHHSSSDRQPLSFFVEKLVAIDQAWAATSSIVARLVLTGMQMDLRILNALRKNMNGDVSAQPMDPFLRVAARYMETTRSAEYANALVRHVCGQARNMQNTEGPVFMVLLNVMLRSDMPRLDLALSRRECCIKQTPVWGPYMLVFPNTNVRREAECLIDHVLFATDSPKDEASTEHSHEVKDYLDEVAYDLGVRCLVYLRDMHVKRRVRIERDAALSILSMVGKCVSRCDSLKDMDDGEDDDLGLLQKEVVEPLRRLMVDEVEDDVSDWDGSCGSSEPMDASLGIPLQTMSEANDIDLM
ncbi:hypothetical protein CDD82_1934 [Ophiocordyceps australis]|uniref:USP domain-containing protein n=1 Tax=Ophiocordyceps australis TaxID=1399860 RepID=A0A2C5ZL83_9HYPO|nr:hypothetical protein CDD82_1934 [Ophiocordyceps australis]